MSRAAAIGRFAIESVLLMLLAAGMLLGVIVLIRHVFDDEKSQYFTIGYYCAIHAGLVKWVWKKLRIEKDPPT